MFTREQIKEIQKKLAIEGARDTDFELAESVRDVDLVAIIQDDTNKKVTMGTLIRDLGEGTVIE